MHLYYIHEASVRYEYDAIVHAYTQIIHEIRYL